MQDPLPGDTDAVLQILNRHGLLNAPDARLTSLAGGVSSEIYKVNDAARVFVVKRALAKLKVKADWYADTSRSYAEQAFIQYVSGFRPDAVPRLIYSSETDGFFTMEYLEGFHNWKEDLLAGYCDAKLAYDAGVLLGEIHNQSWDDGDAARIFDTIKNFDQLRIDPYLRSTALKHKDLLPQILGQADRLSGTKECLVHGDFSPKNLLHLEGRLVALDCEVAWYGDPAFDLSFLLSHLLLKSIYHAPDKTLLVELVDAVRQGYKEKNPRRFEEVESRCIVLLPMLLLARLDGKSPVEYLEDEVKRAFVRKFAKLYISEPANSLDKLRNSWFQNVSDFTYANDE